MSAATVLANPLGLRLALMPVARRDPEGSRRQQSRGRT